MASVLLQRENFLITVAQKALASNAIEVHATESEKPETLSKKLFEGLVEAEHFLSQRGIKDFVVIDQNSSYQIVPLSEKMLLSQIQIVWRLKMGAHDISKKEQDLTVEWYRTRIGNPLPQSSQPAKACTFCNKNVVSKQLLTEKEAVYLLIDRKKFGEGHFLLTPKTHATTFSETGEKAFIESRQAVASLRSAFQTIDVIAYRNFGKATSCKHTLEHVIAVNQNNNLSYLKYLVSLIASHCGLPFFQLSDSQLEREKKSFTK